MNNETLDESVDALLEAGLTGDEAHAEQPQERRAAAGHGAHQAGGNKPGPTPMKPPPPTLWHGAGARQLGTQTRRKG